MNGEVARELGRTVGDDQLTKQAAAVYTEIFEKIASKLGKCAGLNSMEVAELVKSASMTKEALDWWKRMLAGGGAGAATGAGLGLLGGPLAPLTSGAGALIGGGVGALGGLLLGKDDPTTPEDESSPQLKQIIAARKAGIDPVRMGLLRPERRAWGGGGWGGWRPDYSRFAAGPSAIGAGGAGMAEPDLHGPEASRFWARTGVKPSRMQAEQRALRDFAIGAQLRSQLGREFSRLSAQQLF